MFLYHAPFSEIPFVYSWQNTRGSVVLPGLSCPRGPSTYYLRTFFFLRHVLRSRYANIFFFFFSQVSRFLGAQKKKKMDLGEKLNCCRVKNEKSRILCSRYTTKNQAKKVNGQFPTNLGLTPLQLKTLFRDEFT